MSVHLRLSHAAADLSSSPVEASKPRLDDAPSGFAMCTTMAMVIQNGLARGARPTPTTILRLIFRLPTLVFRAHRGWLLGHHFLQLTHQGRRTGKLYQSILEVVQYDPHSGESVVVSAFGERADWYRNTRHAPALQVDTAGRRYQPAQRVLASEEVYAALRAYTRRYAWARVAVRRIFGLRFDDSAVDSADRRARLRGVAFRPGSASAAGGPL
jgi:deazaflavin-dependent oxidoreductase (nitroreductase family)